MIMPPRISVVMPLYNKAPYVNEAIRSALNQDIPVTEIIVIDDGSTDTGPAIVASIPDPRIRLITQPNAGVSVARNNGISAATGDYIAFLDADDRYQPGFLAGITKLIQNFPQAGMFCSAYTCFWADDTRRDRGLTKAAADTALYVPDFYAAWSKSAFTYTSAIVVSRKLFENATLRFPQGEKLGEDQDLWFRIAEKTPVAYLNTSLVDYRMDVQDSATQNQTVLEILPCYARLGERLANGSVPPRLRKGARRLLASHILNIVRANLQMGFFQKSINFLVDRRTLGNPFYFVRTLLAVAGAGLKTTLRS